jgi:hypothetical protein
MNHYFKSSIFLLTILLIVLKLDGQVQYSYQNKKATSVNKWDVVDIVFKAKTSENPFKTEFSADFSKDGKTITVQGFYDGNDHWIIRFSPSAEGQWTYTTKSTIKQLSDKKGVVNALKNVANNHGGIIINPQNPQKFCYEDGTPYFLLAFECDWLFALDYNNNTAIPKTDHLLGLLNKNGFNQIVMNVFSYDVSWEKDKKLKDYPQFEYGATPGAYPFLGDNKNPDFSALNIEFFHKLDRVISSMHDHRIVSHLMIYVWNKLVNWPEMYSDADNMYFEYVVKRYQAYSNLVWDVSKEALYYGRADEKYILDRIERIRKNDAYHRLLSVHDFGFCSRQSDKVDFISTQDWKLDIYDKMLDVNKKFSNKPVFNIEHGGYEEAPFEVFTGAYISPEYCLRRNYECLFAGVYSTYYWQGTSWNIIIYNPFEQPDNFIKPKFEYYLHMQEFFSLHDFSLYKPSPEKSSNGFGLIDDHGNSLIYTPKENYKLAIGWLEKDKKEFTFQWFNTLTGEYTSVQNAKKQSSFRSPWSGTADAILILELQK